MIKKKEKRDWRTRACKFSEKITDIMGLLKKENFLTHNRPYYTEKIVGAVNQLKEKFSETSLKCVDIGCGKRSFFESIPQIHPHIEVFGIDASYEELKVNSFVKNKIVFDCCNKKYEDVLREYQNYFHLVITHDFLEHIKDPFTAHSIINFLLKHDGIAIHSYPLLFDPILTLGHLLPSNFTKSILYKIESFRKDSGKFKTYYRNCRSFSSRLETWYRNLGFCVVDFRNFYGTTYLFAIPPLQVLLNIFYLFILKLKLDFFCSYSVIVLRKTASPCRNTS
ncbi:MAG: class I SAM-dependent methyltransferase [Chitinispirillaceae bacterium]|nr:class I SAM-dependent methyltransferase [Chitinispirillaceae bacterium]